MTGWTSRYRSDRNTMDGPVLNYASPPESPEPNLGQHFSLPLCLIGDALAIPLAHWAYGSVGSIEAFLVALFVMLPATLVLFWCSDCWDGFTSNALGQLCPTAKGSGS